MFAVQEMLGHKSIATTQKYLGVNYASVREAIQKMSLDSELHENNLLGSSLKNTPNETLSAWSSHFVALTSPNPFAPRTRLKQKTTPREIVKSRVTTGGAHSLCLRVEINDPLHSQLPLSSETLPIEEQGRSLTPNPVDT